MGALHYIYIANQTQTGPKGCGSNLCLKVILNLKHKSETGARRAGAQTLRIRVPTYALGLEFPRHKRSQKETGGDRRSQEVTEGARRSQEEPEGARRSQKDPGGARKNQEVTEGARRSQKEPEGTRRSQREPEGARRSQKEPG
jgi:hypothetical protein